MRFNPFGGLAKFIAKNTQSYDYKIKVAASITKRNPSKKTAELLGATDFQYLETTGYNLSGPEQNQLTKVLDTTTYTDKATLTLYNGTGNDRYLTTLQIDGKRIMRYSGSGGGLVHDGLKNENDIRNNGERLLEVSNNYIVTAAQAAKIADYHWKFSGKAKHLYAIEVKGTALWYAPGLWYRLQLGGPGTNEYIDATVECYAVEIERGASDIGATRLLLRDVEDNWSKTTLYAARLVSGGSPKRRVNRSNIVTVASSTYDGTYDYRCDGTADDVQIQAAVDYLLDSFNGGEVKLTSGDYRFADPVVLKNGVKIVGCGQSTRILPADNTVTTLIDFGTATNATIESFNIDGDGSSIVYTTTVGPILGRRLGKAINVNITNYYIKPTSTTKAFVGFYMMVATYNCDVYEITAENDGGIPRLYGFQLCTGVTNCSIYSNEVIGNGWIQGMVNCDNISNCTIYSNTSTSGTVHIIGYYICNNITSSSYHDNSVNGTSEIFGYYQSYNISSCTSVDNTSVNVGVVSFFECIRVSVCSTSGNVSSGTNEWGYWGCRSVQQCKASGESLPYGTGTNQSYADSAGAAGYECDDTPEGGYNS